MKSYTNLFVFGDSLSDCGRTLKGVNLGGKGLGGTYYNFRYSDGPIYLDQLCEKIGLHLPDDGNVYARGSATTDSDWCQASADQ